MRTLEKPNNGEDDPVKAVTQRVWHVSKQAGIQTYGSEHGRWSGVMDRLLLFLKIEKRKSSASRILTIKYISALNKIPGEDFRMWTFNNVSLASIRIWCPSLVPFSTSTYKKKCKINNRISSNKKGPRILKCKKIRNVSNKCSMQPVIGFNLSFIIISTDQVGAGLPPQGEHGLFSLLHTRNLRQSKSCDRQIKLHLKAETQQNQEVRKNTSNQRSQQQQGSSSFTLGETGRNCLK